MKSRLLVAMCIFMGFMPILGHSAIFSISEMTVTGGSFGLDQSGGPFILPFQTIGPNTNLIGGYLGNGGAGLDSVTPDPNSIVGMQYSGFALNTYTAATNLGDDNTVVGSQIGGTVPSGTLDTVAGTITMDLSSWFANWNNNDIHSGTGKNDGVTSAFATGMWNPLTGEYSLSWQSAAGAPYLNTSYWTLEGIASPVPVPAAMWLFGSGLLGLVGMARKKPNQQLRTSS
ncbi:VPLPA-CTERM sorting domain-containing protein [Pseudomonadota bacterium]